MINILDFCKNLFVKPKEEKPNILQGPNASDYVMISDIAEKIIETARKYVGVKESGGNNQGPVVNEFQKAVDGKAMGEPWCACFVAYVTNEVCEFYGVKNPLHKTEHCQTLYSSTLDRYKRRHASEGTIFIKKSRVNLNGHTGFNTNGGTIEGNTNDGTSRDGDGVYEKLKPIADDSRMFVRGHIDLPQMIFDEIKKKPKGKLG